MTYSVYITDLVSTTGMDLRYRNSIGSNTCDNTDTYQSEFPSSSNNSDMETSSATAQPAAQSKNAPNKLTKSRIDYI